MAAMMQSISAAISPAVFTRLPATNRSVFYPKRQSIRVRCTAESEEPKEQPIAPSESASVPPPPQPKPKVSPKFSDVLAFSGPAPERINGRLAMIGFVAALAAEVGSGQDLFAQLSNGGAVAFLGTSLVLSVASLIPLLKGVSVESKSNGLMTSDAEMWNGRFAMLGLVALAFTEYVKGGAFV